MFWTSPAAPKKSFSSPLRVPNLVCGAKKKKHSPAGPVEFGGSENAKIIFRNGLRKKNIHGRPENSRELKNAKNHFSQMACEKKTFTAPPIWGVRKKNIHSTSARWPAKKKSFTTGLKIVKMRKMIFRTRLESLLHPPPPPIHLSTGQNINLNSPARA